MRKFAAFVILVLVETVEAQPALHLKTRVRDQVVASQAAQSRTPGRSHWIVQFTSLPEEEQLAQISGLGGAALSYIPENALVVSAPSDANWEGVEARWIGQLAAGDKVSPALPALLAENQTAAVLVEFYPDVDPGDVRAIANQTGLFVQENPDLLPYHLLVWGTADQVSALAAWDEIAYLFPASSELATGVPVRACAGALTSLGPVGQSVALIDDGWDGPGLGTADLKYTFVHLTEKLPRDAAESEIERAFAEWAKYVKVTFSESADSSGQKTISVLFASGDHGDGYPFDGPGRILAHTFYPFPTNFEPLAGDMHFDNDESWKIGANVDLFSLALHEAGHALGLGHSDNPTAVMYPYYFMHSSLQPDDIAAIRELYAARDESQPANPAPPAAPPAPTPPQPAPATPLLLVVQAPPASTTAASISLSGALSGGAGTIALSWKTNQGFSGAAQAAATWSISSVPLNTGANIITVGASDSQQNSVSQTVTVTRVQAPAPTPTPPPPTPNPQPSPSPGPDTTPPSLTIVSPANTTISTSATSIVVTGTASDNVGVAKVTWTSSTGGSGTASGTTSWNSGPISLYVGTTTVVIHASDAAGNTSWRSLVITRK